MLPITGTEPGEVSLACICGTWSYSGPAVDAVEPALKHLQDHPVKENRIYIS